MEQPGSAPVPSVAASPQVGYVRTENQGLAIASLVFGIVAIMLSPILVGIFGGLVGLPLGLVHLVQRRRPAGMAKWGTGLSAFGIVASVALGLVYYRTYKSLKSAMLSGKGGLMNINHVPAPARLPGAPRTWKVVPLWSVPLGSGRALCTGDWNDSGSDDALVVDGSRLLVYDQTGKPLASVALSEPYTAIEWNHNKTKPGRLLAYSNWGHSVDVLNRQGSTAWSYSVMMGVDGAHWGDLNGDGVDEMVVGANGFGGLHLVSADGSDLWHATLGNVWNQAIVSAAKGLPARVLATDASGSVHIFDNNGHELNALRPHGGYYAPINAMRPSPRSPGQIQILGDATGSIVAFDPSGTVAWSVATPDNHALWRSHAFVAGDIDGDGIKDWVYSPTPGQLVMVTAQGKQLCQLATTSLEGYGVISRTHQPGLLLTLTKNQLQAFTFQ